MWSGPRQASAVDLRKLTTSNHRELRIAKTSWHPLPFFVSSRRIVGTNLRIEKATPQHMALFLGIESSECTGIEEVCKTLDIALFVVLP